MPYTYQPYPAYRYGLSGATRVVNNLDEDNSAHEAGFVNHPSLVGVPKPKPDTAKIAPAVVRTNKAVKEPTKAKAEKAPEAVVVAPAATALEQAIETAIEHQPPAFDRAVAIATLEAANFEVDPATTDEELVEALAELAK